MHGLPNGGIVDDACVRHFSPLAGVYSNQQCSGQVWLGQNRLAAERMNGGIPRIKSGACEASPTHPHASPFAQNWTSESALNWYFYGGFTAPNTTVCETSHIRAAASGRTVST